MNHRIGLCKATLLLASMPCVGAEFFYMDHNPFTNEYVGPTGRAAPSLAVSAS